MGWLHLVPGTLGLGPGPTPGRAVTVGAQETRAQSRAAPWLSGLEGLLGAGLRFCWTPWAKGLELGIRPGGGWGHTEVPQGLHTLEAEAEGPRGWGAGSPA